jgi:capsular exopolysaccharide synthesis family protein
MKESREIIHRQPPVETTEIERPYEYQVAPAVPGRYPVYREAAEKEGFQLADYWRAIRKRLWLVIGIAVLVTTLAAIYMARKPNVYQAKAIVQVDLEQANPDLLSNDRASRMLPSGADSSYFNTQLQLLISESLLRRVVKEYSYDSNKEIQQLKIENSTSAWRGMLKTVGLASDEPVAKKEDAGPGSVSTVPTSGLASSDEVNEAARLSPYVEVIRKNLAVEPVRESRATLKDTRLIEVTWRHTNPELTAAVVNAICETFTKQNQEKRSGTSRKTNDFLQERIANLQAEIKSDEVKYVDDTRAAGILRTGDEEQTIVIERLAGLNKDLLEAENKRKEAEATYLSVKAQPEKARELAEAQMGRYMTEQEMVIRNQEIETAKKKQDLRVKREALLAEYREGSDEVKDIDRQIKVLEDSMTGSIEKNKRELGDYRNRSARTILVGLQVEYEKALGKEQKIRADFQKQYGEAQGQNLSAVNIKLLQQKIETNKGFLENLQKQVSGNDIVNKGTDNNINVAEIAIPNDVAVSPRRLTTVLAAFFLSTLFGMGLALFLEYLDDTIRTAEEIENYLQLPALAAIPTIDSVPKRKLLLVGNSEGEDEETNPNAELLIHTDSRSSLAEAYRQLRTSILLSTAGHAPKSLLITSSLPSEGKTTTATNTAISLAQTGAKVLIIDADMRRPRLHQVFNITNGAGLSTLLSSEFDEKQLLDIVQYDEKSKLNLLPSGPVPPNPAELIGSEQMSYLLKKLQNHFTHVVIDSPPIASFTDGVLIASMVDGVILVVHAGKSSRQVVKRSKQLLNDIGAKVLGVVLNNVNLRSQDNYYYYQTYYHRSTYNSPDRD